MNSLLKIEMIGCNVFQKIVETSLKIPFKHYGLVNHDLVTLFFGEMDFSTYSCVTELRAITRKYDAIVMHLRYP